MYAELLREMGVPPKKSTGGQMVNLFARPDFPWKTCHRGVRRTQGVSLRILKIMLQNHQRYAKWRIMLLLCYVMLC